MDKRFGHYSFAIGVLIAVILSLAGTMHFGDETKLSLISLLVMLGILVGILNITGSETREFLLSSGIFVIIALLALNMRVLDGIPYIGTIASDLLRSIVSFTMPTVLVVSVKNIWRLAKTK